MVRGIIIVTCKICGLFTKRGNFIKLKSTRAGSDFIICNSCKEDLLNSAKYICERCGFGDEDKTLFYEIVKSNAQIKIICVKCLGELREDERKMFQFVNQ